MATTKVEGVKVSPEETVRVYADIDVEAEARLKMRAIHYGIETGQRVNRKQYLEKLIADDVAKVQGAALRIVTRTK